MKGEIHFGRSVQFSHDHINNKENYLFTDGTTFTTVQASNTDFFIDDIVNLKCLSDGNPNPNYTWKLNHTEIRSNSKYNISVDKTQLSFTISNISDSGCYQCVASNNINGKLFNRSSNVTLTIQNSNKEEHPFELQKSCNENLCLSVQSCVLKNGLAFCSLNIWIVIAIVFIIITLILCTTTLSLILLRKAKRLKAVHHAEEMDMGYVETKLQEPDILIVRVEIAQLLSLIHNSILRLKITNYLLLIGQIVTIYPLKLPINGSSSDLQLFSFLSNSTKQRLSLSCWRDKWIKLRSSWPEYCSCVLYDAKQ